MQINSLVIASAAVALAAVANGAAADRSHREVHKHPRGSLAATSFAIIGDAPYGSPQVETVDALIDAIGERNDVSAVVHLGDTKSGGSACSDAYFEYVLSAFNRFQQPLFYVPGDNEWTDCHRDSAGDYNPVERLNKLRDIYFQHPGKAFGGAHFRVSTQADCGYPENQTWYESGVQIGLIHIVGSNNGLAPWELGPELLDVPEVREAEVSMRTEAAISWMDRIFDDAERKDAAGVLLVWHADMWSAFEHSGALDMGGFAPIVQRLAARASAFGKPVLIVNGDSHDFYAWKPLSDEDTHPLAMYYADRELDLATVGSAHYFGAGGAVENVTQVVFEVWDSFAPEPEGFGAEDFGWLEVKIDASSPDVFGVEQHLVDMPTAE